MSAQKIVLIYLYHRDSFLSGQKIALSMECNYNNFGLFSTIEAF